MKKIINKKIALFSITTAIALLLVSLTSVVGFQATYTSFNPNSPLFNLRLEKIINEKNEPSLSTIYIGKNKIIQIPLPIRELITEEILNQLSTQKIKENINYLDNNLVKKWENILTIARNNLDEINRIIRQNYKDFQTLVKEYNTIPEQDLRDQLKEQIYSFDLNELNKDTIRQFSYESQGNITSGLICNITSGQFCQITSQPICHITTQPICSITKGFMCWTIIGPICPTTGIKCHTPTTRPSLCSIFTAAGKILKTIIIILLLATVIFVPIALLTLAFITIFNPDKCDQIHEQITTWFNCTTPE